MSYLSALLIRMDLSAESFTVDTIGGVIIIANVPICICKNTCHPQHSRPLHAGLSLTGQLFALSDLVIDTYKTMKDEMMTAQIDLLASELGAKGDRYLCKMEVEITDKLQPSIAAASLREASWEGVSTKLRAITIN